MFSHVLGKNWREKYWKEKIGEKNTGEERIGEEKLERNNWRGKLVSTISILEYYCVFLDKIW